MKEKKALIEKLQQENDDCSKEISNHQEEIEVQKVACELLQKRALMQQKKMEHQQKWLNKKISAKK